MEGRGLLLLFYRVVLGRGYEVGFGYKGCWEVVL